MTFKQGDIIFDNADESFCYGKVIRTEGNMVFADWYESLEKIKADVGPSWSRNISIPIITCTLVETEKIDDWEAELQ